MRTNPRRARRRGNRLGQANPDQGVAGRVRAAARPTLVNLPGRLPLLAKVTVEVRPPIDLIERFGPKPEREQVYEEITGGMQDRLSELREERNLPLIG